MNASGKCKILKEARALVVEEETYKRKFSIYSWEVNMD